MSLEDALNKNTEAVKELALIMAGIRGTPAATGEATTSTTDKPNKTADKAKGETAGKQQEKKSAETATGQAGSTETETSAGAGAESTELDYSADVVPAVTAVAKKFDRDTALAVLEPFGVTSARDLDKSKWAELIAACKAKCEEE